MHKSYLEFGCNIEDFLIKGISVDSVGGMVGLCLGVAVFTLIYEGVKTLRHYLGESRNRKQDENSPSVHHGSERSLLVQVKTFSSGRMKFHIIQAALYMIQVMMGYILMLIIMSYNAWLAITVFLTSGVSYYFFGLFVLSKPMVIPLEILPSEEN